MTDGATAVDGSDAQVWFEYPPQTKRSDELIALHVLRAINRINRTIYKQFHVKDRVPLCENFFHRTSTQSCQTLHLLEISKMRDAIYKQLLSRQAVKDYNTKYDEELSYEDCIAQLEYGLPPKVSANKWRR